ncbi:NYN domain-containing protein [Dongia sedimenti]|uniref:NYN domain-containing protein n=1 Tax=Dongia sedimenti TaxID=3064282 RepID=A0ABU0YLS9_9PROT|nr:NYN domain-containing protein [Rhodospirillaceae bacterium R-7]
MAIEPRSPRLAVLIDADNTSPRIAAGLFEEVAKMGEASVRRIYGDFSSTRLKSWADLLNKYAIVPHQNFAYTTGKNASDIALVIDAMDLLYSGRFDGFCLVSSDSDFTRLAARIREQGVDVYGFGAKKTPESFRQACRRFIYTENLLPEAPAPNRAAAPEAAKSLEPTAAAVALLTRVIAQMSDEDGWVGLRGVGQRLSNLAPDFDPRTYGAAKLGDLVAKSGAFEIKRQASGDMLIRPKGQAVATAAPPARAQAPAAKPVVEPESGNGEGVARTTARRGTRRRSR